MFTLAQKSKFYISGENQIFEIDEESKIAKFLLKTSKPIQDILVGFSGRIIYTTDKILIFDNEKSKPLHTYLKCNFIFYIYLGKSNNNIKLNKKKSKILFQNEKCEICSISLTTFKLKKENKFTSILGDLVQFLPFQYITARGEKDNIAILTEKGAIQFQFHFLSIFLGVKMEEEKYSCFDISFDLKYIVSCSFIECENVKENSVVKIYLFQLDEKKKKYSLSNQIEFESKKII